MSILTRTSAQVRVAPLTDRLTDDVRWAWETVLAAQPAVYSVFQYPEWIELAICSGVIDDGFALIVSDGSTPIGVLPCYARTHWSAEIMLPLNPNPMPLLMAPGAEAEVMAGLAAWLRRGMMAMVTVGRYTEEQLARYDDWLSREDIHGQTHATDSVFWVPLPMNWDAYLHGLPCKSRYNVRQAERAILRDYPDAECSIENDPARCTEAVEALMQFSRLRWRNEKQHSVFERSRMVAYYRQFMAWAVAQGYGHVAVLRIHDRIIAVATVLHLPGSSVAYYHQVGRDMAYLDSRYSPGVMLVSRVICWAIDNGVTRFSMGLGMSPYKLEVGGIEHPQQMLTLARSRQSAALLRKIDPAVQVMNRQFTRLLQL